MPIYAYKCASCGHAKDVLQKISDALLTECPACGAQAFGKQLTAAGFQLKGSGWYATDFKNNSSAPPSAEKPADGKPADSKGDSGSTQPAESIKPAESGKSDAPAAAGGCGSAGACH